MSLDELPQDWWLIADNEAGGYQYRSVVRVLGKNVETMLDGSARSNRVTEELVVGMLNHAKSLGIGAEDPRFPIVRFKRCVLNVGCVQTSCMGLLPVQLKGAAVICVRLLEGRTIEDAKEGPRSSCDVRSPRRGL